MYYFKQFIKIIYLSKKQFHKLQIIISINIIFILGNNKLIIKTEKN